MVWSRRTLILAFALSFLVGSLLLVQQHTDYLGPTFRSQLKETGHLDAFCHTVDPFEVEYGRTNLRMTRAYEGKNNGRSVLTLGSRHRLERFIRKVMAGPEVTISTIGGSSQSYFRLLILDRSLIASHERPSSQQGRDMVPQVCTMARAVLQS
jgi:hypothetical protein